MANKVILTGNIGKIETRYTNNGDPITNASLATTKKWKDKQGQRQEKTQWHRLKFFGALAGVAEKWVNKGDKLYIEGEIEYGQYDNNGTTVYTTDIVVKEMEMLGSKQSNNQAQQPNQGYQNPPNQTYQQPAPQQAYNQAQQQPNNDFDDDIPF